MVKAVILAAGRSSRLYPVTLEIPKCLLEIEKGKTIIEYQIETLRKCGIDDITVVTGYLKEKIKEKLGDSVKYKDFEDYAKYNNMHTLYSIKDKLDDDVVILFADVLLGKNLLEKCVKSDKDFCLLIHNKEILTDTMRVIIKDGGIVDIGSHVPVETADGNFIGIGKYSKEGIRKLIEEAGKMIDDSEHDNDYYTIPLINLSKENKIGFEFVGDDKWIEIDFLKDYHRAKDEVYPLIKD